MPRLVRWYLRTALIYFSLALLAGVLLTLPAIDIPAMTPIYFHLLMVGWVTQLIVGVAYWMFPRYSKTSARGPEWLGYAVFGLLNLGLVLRVIGELLNAIGIPWSSGILAASAFLQLLAGWLIVAALWPRVRER